MFNTEKRDFHKKTKGLWAGGIAGVGLESGGVEMGLHASSGKGLPGVLLRIINRLSMSGSR